MSKQKRSRVKRIGLLLTMMMVFTMVTAPAAPAMALAGGTHDSEVFNEPVQPWGYRVRINTSTTYITTDEQGGTISNNKNRMYLITQGSWKFTANPKTGYVFDGWTINDGDSDAFSISGNSITISYEGNQNYTATANFHEVPKYKLTTNVPSGHGSISRSPDQSEYTEGDSVQLTASPEPGYRFKQWSVDASGTDNPITIEMNSAKTVEATFEPLPTYTLDVGINPAGSGTVSKDPDVSSYWEGREVKLTPSAASGYRFGSWSGDASGSANPLTLSMNGNKSITANFVKQYYITLNASHGYFHNENAVEGWRDGNSTINLGDANPDSNIGYSFLGWKDDQTGQMITDYKTEDYTFTLTSDRSFTAVFTGTEYLGLLAADNGSLDNDISGHYAEDSKVNLNDAEPTGNTGYILDCWKEYGFLWAGSGTEVPLVGGEPIVNIGESNYFKAIFKVANYTISYDLDGGSVNPVNPVGYTIKSSGITLNNPTKTGYTFAGWTGTGLSGSTMTVTIPTGSTGDRSYTATWTAVSYDIDYDLDGGTVSPENPSTYTIEDSFTLNNPTKDGYDFAGWEGTGITGTSTSVTIPTGSTGDREYTAHWVLADYSISYDLDGGTVSPVNPTSYTIESSDITLNNPAKTGYTFAGWEGTDLSGATMSVTIPTGSTGDRSYTATWTANTYTVVYNANTGAGVMNPSTHTYDVPKDLRANAFTKEGCTFDGWALTANGDVEYTDKESVSNLATDNGATVTLYAKWSISGVTVDGYDDVYDGNGHSVTVSGTLPGDTVSYSTDGGTTYSGDQPFYTNASAGVTVYVKVERSGAVDYIGSADVKIAKADSTIDVQGVTVTYDGSAHGAIGTATGADGSSLASLLNLGDSFTNVPGGTADWSFDGDENHNPASGSVDIIINKADATIDVQGVTVTYDGNAHGAIGTATGADESDLSSLLNLGSTYTDVPGGKADWSFAGDANHNPASGSVDIVINKATLTIKANNQYIPYAHNKPNYTVSYRGFKGSDDKSVLKGSPSLKCSYDRGDDAGSYTIKVSRNTLLDAANYDLSFDNGTLHVRKASLTVTADNKSVTYGDPAPAYTARYSGFINGDDQGDLGGTLAFSCSYTAGSPVSGSPYTITPRGLSSNNYSIAYGSGQLTVSAPAGAATTATVTPTPSPSPDVSPSPTPEATPAPEEIESTPEPTGTPAVETIGDEEVPTGEANAKGTGFFSHWWSWMILAFGLLLVLLVLLLILSRRKREQEQH